MYGTTPLEIAASLGALSLDELRSWNADLLRRGNQPPLARLVQFEISRRQEPLNTISAVSSFSNRQLKDFRVARQFPLPVVQTVIMLRKRPAAPKHKKKAPQVMKKSSVEEELLAVPDNETVMEVDDQVAEELLSSSSLDEIIRTRKEGAEQKKKEEEEKKKQK